MQRKMFVRSAGMNFNFFFPFILLLLLQYIFNSSVDSFRGIGFRWYNCARDYNFQNFNIRLSNYLNYGKKVKEKIHWDLVSKRIA